MTNLHKQRIFATVLAGALTLRARTLKHDARQRGDTHRHTEIRAEDSRPRRPRKKCTTRWTFSVPCRPILWSFPAVSFESIRIGTSGIWAPTTTSWSSPTTSLDAKGVWLTANDTTIYALANVDLGKQGRSSSRFRPGRRGPYRRLLAARGHRRRPARPRWGQGRQVSSPAARLHRRGSQGRLPRPAGHDEQLQLYDPRPRGEQRHRRRRQLIKKMRVYPWSERDNPKANKFVSMSGKKMDTIPPDGIEYWARLSAFINNNPVHERDRFFMAMLKPLGIEKGKAFKPDARQRAILEDAAKVGHAMARTLLFNAEQRISGATAFPGTNWDWVVLWIPTRKPTPTANSTSGCTTSTARSTCRPPSGERRPAPARPTSRPSRTRTATTSTAASPTACTCPRTYRCRAFWSLTLYDTETRSMIQNSTNDSARSGYDKLKTNADGSIDLYFGPKAPRGRGEQLDPDGSWQRLLSVLPLLRPQRGRVRRDMEAARHRTGEAIREANS